MADYSNYGYLSRNSRRKSDNQPEYTGKGNYDGVDFDVAAWVKTRDDGSRYFSLKFSEPYEPKKTAVRQENVTTDEDIPF